MKIYLKWPMTVISPWRPENTPCRRPRTPPKCFPDASKVPPSRFQHAPKPQGNRQDGPRSLKDVRKTLHDASLILQHASKWHLRRLWDAPKRLQNGLASSKNQLCREVDSSDTKEKDYSTPIWSLQIPALRTHALAVLTCCFLHDHDFATAT